MVILAVFTLIAHSSIVSTFGIYFRPLTIEFGWDRGALSVAASIRSLLGGSFGILAGRLCDKYGPRPVVAAGGILAGIAFLLMSRISSLWNVYLIWGLLMGIAFTFVLVPITSTVPKWFSKRRGIAQGLTWAGGSLGAAFWPTFTQWIISSYGWRLGYVIAGSVFILIIIPVAYFMKRSPKDIGLKPYGAKEDTYPQPQTPVADGLSFREAINTIRFRNVGVTLFFSSFCLQVISVHVVSHAIDVGVPEMIAASIMSIVAIVSIVARLSIGFFSDRAGPRVVLSCCIGVLTLALVVLIFAKDVWMFYLFAIAYGIAWGCHAPLIALVAAELFGLKYLGTITAALMFSGTIGGAIATPLAGYMFDVTGSYSLAFQVLAIIGILAVFLSLSLLRYEKY